MKGHDGVINGCAFSPDGRRVVSASFDTTLKIWDPVTGAEQATLTGHEGVVIGCDVSPDGRLIASASGDGTLKLWDAAGGEALRTLRGHAGDVRSCAFSPDGKLVVSASADRTLRIWDTASGREAGTLEGHSEEITDCAFSPDGRRIASVSAGETLIWDAASARSLSTLEGAGCCAFSPDGRWLVHGANKTLQVRDAETNAEIATLEGHTGSVLGCAFSPDGQWIASACQDGILILWETPPGRERRTLRGHSDWVADCAFSADGRWLLSAGWDLTLKLWDLRLLDSSVEGRRANGRLEFAGHAGRVDGIEFDPDGRRIATASADGTVKIWDADSGAELAVLEGHVGEVADCAFGPDAKLIVSTDRTSQVLLREPSAGDRPMRLRTPLGGPLPGGLVAGFDGCAFSPDGRWIAAAGVQLLVVWDARSAGEPKTLVGHQGWVSRCAFSPEGRKLASAGADRTVRVWDTSSGAEVATLEGHTDQVADCAFSPDGRRIVSASHDGTLRLWYLEEEREPTTLLGHTGRVNACALSPDGRWIFSGGTDETVRVWDAASGLPRAILAVAGIVTSIAAHPSLARLACGDFGGALYVVDLVGLTYGPLLVTAARRRGATDVRCPACGRRFPVEAAALGTEITCPDPGCHAGLRLAPAVMDRAPEPVERSPGPRPAARVFELLDALMGSGNWTACRRLVEANQEILLSPEADAALAMLMHDAGDTAARDEIAEHRELLQRCRRHGIEAAFASVGEVEEAGPIFRWRNMVDAVLEFVNAETWAESQAIVEARSDLLLDEEADEVFVQLVELNRDDLDTIADLDEHRELLARCRAVGVDLAFDELLE
jgi:WD40 repeat protein